MEKITLQISDYVSIEIDNPTDVMENYSQEFYTYYEHEYEINFEDGELTNNKLREVVLEKRFEGSKNTDLQEVLIKAALLDIFSKGFSRRSWINPSARHSFRNSVVFVPRPTLLPHNNDTIYTVKYQLVLLASAL